MISQRLISRLAGRKAGFFDQSIRISSLRSDRPFTAQSSLSDNSEHRRESHSRFPAMSENSKSQTRLFDSIVPSSAGNLGMKLRFSQAESFPGAMSFRRFLHSATPKEFEKETDTRPYETDGNTRPNEMFRNIRSIEMERNPRNSGPFERRWNRDIERNTGPFEIQRDTGTLDTNINSRNTGPFERGLGTRTTERNTRLFDSNGRPNESNIRPLETGRDTGSMNFARGILNDNRRDYFGGNRFSQHTIEQNADIVHIKLMRNNSYVTVTDSKGNKKVGASGGLLSAMKGGPKVSRYSAEATAEYVGRLAKNMGLKSVVVKVSGFTYFKKKKQAILGFRDGYTNSRSDQNPIVYIEDTTRRAHNGCRLRKKRRI